MKPVSSRLLLAIAVALAIIAAANFALISVYAPYGSNSQVTWRDFRSAEGEVDTVLIGSSFAIYNINPYTVDEHLDALTYNLSSPSQSIGDALLNLRCAVDERPIKRVILSIGYETFTQTPQIRVSLINMLARADNQNPLKQIREFARLALLPQYRSSASSFEALLPWSGLYSPEGAVSELQAIAQRKTDYPDPADLTSVFDAFSFYVGRGHVDRADYNVWVPWREQSLQVYERGAEPLFKHENVQAFEALCDFCRDNNLQLYVLVSPRPSFEVQCLNEAYPTGMTQLQAIAQERGAAFIDYNLARPEFYRANIREFSDLQHLNRGGVRRWSERLARDISAVEAGDDISNSFFAYNEWNNYLASLEGISAVKYFYGVGDGAIEFDAFSYAGSETQVEYSYRLVDTEGWVTIRPYSIDPHFSYPVEGHGVLKMVICARTQGSDVLMEQYFENEIEY